MAAHYQLQARSEEGELAELHRGVRIEDGTPVEVKLFHTFTSDPVYAREILRTAAALEAVRSEGPGRLLEVGVVEGRLAVIREAVDGPSLGQLLQRLVEREQHLSVGLALSLAIGLSEDVHAAHDAGVVHGCLTPGNVRIGEGGRLRIADFGALHALWRVPALRRGLSSRGRTVYRAPEAGEGAEGLNPAADVYALGAIAYELLTLREVLHDEGGAPVPPSRVDRRLTSRMDAPIVRALAIDPLKRTRSAGDLAVGLRNLLSEIGGPPGPEPLRLLLADLFAGERDRGGEDGPPGIVGPFQLQKIEGVELTPIRVLEAPPRARRSYSRRARGDDAPPEELPTEEASPELLSAALGALYAGVPAMSDDSSRATPLETELPKGTEPVAAPEVEAWEAPAASSWDAPASKVAAPQPPARKSALNPEGSGVRRTGRHGRLKLIEDFAPLEDEEVSQVSKVGRRPAGSRRLGDDEPSQVGAAPRARQTGARRAVGADEAAPPRSSGVRKSVIPKIEEDERDSLAEYEQQLEDRKRQKELEEAQKRYLAQRQERTREKLLRFVVALAMLLSLIVGLALYFQESLRPDFTPPPPVPIGVAAEDAKFLAFGPLATTEPEPEPETGPRSVAPANSGFLTVRSNLPGEIYVDGEPLKRRAPATRIPVKPGKAQIDVVSMKTKERRTFQATFQKGKTHTIDVRFSEGR